MSARRSLSPEELAALLRETRPAGADEGSRRRDELEGGEPYPQNRCDPEWARQWWQALMLASDLETFEALLDGEKVPVERLRPEWVQRFGRRR